MADTTATIREVGEVIELFYPTLLWELHNVPDTNLEYDDLIVLENSPIRKPPLAEFKSHIPAARQSLAAKRAKEIKARNFQERYPLQTQSVSIIQAILSGNNTELTAMQTYWQSL